MVLWMKLVLWCTVLLVIGGSLWPLPASYVLPVVVYLTGRLVVLWIGRKLKILTYPD